MSGRTIEPPAGPRQPSGRARPLRRRRSRIVTGCRSTDRRVGAAADAKRNGRRRRAAGREGLRYPWGNDIDASRANFLDRSVDAEPSAARRPTGTYPPNAYGLYDVCGNVGVGRRLVHSADYYGLGDMRDPRGPQTGNMRIVRGGSWVNDDVSMLRCAYRHKVPPDTYAYSIGFRIVCGAVEGALELSAVSQPERGPRRSALSPAGYAKGPAPPDAASDPCSARRSNRSAPCGMADRQRKDHLSALCRRDRQPAAVDQGGGDDLRPLRRAVSRRSHIPDAAAIAAQSDDARCGRSG